MKFIKFFREARSAERSFTPVEILHLADGVIAVRDSGHEYDAYFDIAEWEAANANLNFDAPFPKEHGLGIIRDLLQFLPNGTSVTMEIFAPHVKNCLRSKGNKNWYEPLPPVQHDLMPRFKRY
ncbi:MAG: hypothetical protein V4438_01760 [Patescibacteria group bacterium]